MKLNIKKLVFTLIVVTILTFIVNIVTELFSSTRAGLAVHQLNGTDAEYAISVLISRIQGISLLAVNLLAIILIWKKEIVQGIKTLTNK